MGYEARCRAWIDGSEVDGRALLESDELVFRGERRLRVRLRDITAVDAVDGRLTVTYPAGAASFAVGPPAARWAERIRNPRGLLDKLGVLATSRVLVLDVADRDVVGQLRARAATVTYGSAESIVPEGSGTESGQPLGDSFDLIFLGVEELGALQHLTALRAWIVPAGTVWVIHPKGRRDLRDVDVMAAGKLAGLVDTKVARFSDTHSALRFVIPRDAR